MVKNAQLFELFSSVFFVVILWFYFCNFQNVDADESWSFCALSNQTLNASHDPSNIEETGLWIAVKTWEVLALLHLET